MNSLNTSLNSPKTIIGYFTNWQELISYMDDELILLGEKDNFVRFISKNTDEQLQLKSFLLKNLHPVAKNDSSFILQNDLDNRCSDYTFVINTILTKEEYQKLYSQTNKKLYLLSDERLLINISEINEQDILERIGEPNNLTNMIPNISNFPFN